MILAIILGVLAVGIFLILCIAGWWIGSYNTFRVGQQDIKTQWSNVKTEYQRRADMFVNLAEAVKSYKKFERDTLREVIQARGGNFGATKPEEMKNLRKLDSIFSRLMVVFERYPELKANEQHNELMREIRVTEDRINVARTDYNEIVGDYNKMVTMFPSNTVASHYGFKEETFFENEPESNKSPKIKLD